MEKTKIQKPKVGKLVLVENGGHRILAADKPFAFLQHLKKQLIGNGMNRDNLKITY